MGLSNFFANMDERKKEEGWQRIDFGKMTFVGALNYTNLGNYKMMNVLGQGANAIVREATHIDTGLNVAIKIYDKFKLEQNLNIKKSVQSEIKVLN